MILKKPYKQYEGKWIKWHRIDFSIVYFLVKHLPELYPPKGDSQTGFIVIKQKEYEQAKIAEIGIIVKWEDNKPYKPTEEDYRTFIKAII